MQTGIVLDDNAVNNPKNLCKFPTEFFQKSQCRLRTLSSPPPPPVCQPYAKNISCKKDFK